jgi:enoyl-CoA hydratase/3-hydroxyacyl-CoA dehydrogenase
MAGADLQFFIEQIKAQHFDRIVDFAKDGQKLFDLIDGCEKPVICCMNGAALGGGLELALCCDYIVASEGAQMGFPETGIGIYPGLGGTQRTPRRIGVPLARYLVLTGDIVSAQTALDLGLIDEVVASDALEARAFELALTPLPTLAKKVEPSSSFDEHLEIFQTPLPALLLERLDAKRPHLQKLVQRLRNKAPIALQAADQLILDSATLKLEQGLERELNGLKSIFMTEDALHGLSSVGKSRPQFQGL